MSLSILPYEAKENIGFDLLIEDDNATVQDYLDRINKYILDGQYTRLRRDIRDCEGCNGCCSERIPLTYVDVLKLSEAPYVKELLGKDKILLKELIEQLGQIIIEGQGVDIILDRTETGECIFLNDETKRCKVYQYRPLVCQTFICCKQSEKAEELRNTIVNLGEDELVRQWLQECLKRREPLFFHEAHEPNVRVDDWLETPFSKGTYEKVLLKEVCEPNLWQALKEKK